MSLIEGSSISGLMPGATTGRPGEQATMNRQSQRAGMEAEQWDERLRRSLGSFCPFDPELTYE